MNKYTNSDLEKLLGEKGHIIRYWEKAIPIIQPQKDGSGKFVYSTRDVQMLLRVKHLINTRKFTIEGARDALLNELSGDKQDIKSEIEALRSELLNIYFINKSHNKIDEQIDDNAV
jgi:DNA-binding transcriptional MerR regulator